MLIPNYWALVPAAGIGSRMGSQRPKQYLHLHNKPILQHTLERLNLPAIAGIVVCVAEHDPYWETLTLPMPVMRVNGGAERCHSVLNGLQALQQQAQPDDWVLVHDAARPCVRQADIEKLMTELAHHPVGGLLAVPVRDTMKRADANSVETVNREGLWHALTPQMFRLEALSNALQNLLSRGEHVTDDAQAMEKMGQCPVLIEGHADNIKITHPQDLSLAELYL
ncbi:2-C-methyl-D-erythritol 4-phosphate cytidylyltransferase [Candidatus Thiomargarita nelsonii]|uniref:2-C-methyl-D-erythritol 4-phosphate cytidylyltransferase n=1 Tax=Candidatus Thiomargarita nelsonii TaxID=1003181 RepID=A0A0A6PEC3_9GAMM|nr:2-C-methyl-D-erythritol 4-phosphate cytidylyltransferase [Candidatus Thiomargarita nelsonii]